ncbi:hypothetical protein HZA86_04485 [Candidatus Uhrbacteria bacterium]|nr:hypothetical protein [Candidatus Uhrbacteria bacterium]
MPTETVDKVCAAARTERSWRMPTFYEVGGCLVAIFTIVRVFVIADAHCNGGNGVREFFSRFNVFGRRS